MSKKNTSHTFPKNPITSRQYFDIIRELDHNIYAILESCEKLIELQERQKLKVGKNDVLIINPNLLMVTAGLYTHCIEEFGKFYLLKRHSRLIPSGQYKGEYDLSSIKKQFFNHQDKFRIAFSKLPSICKNIGYDLTKGITKPSEEFRVDIFHVGLDELGLVRKIPEIDFNKLSRAVKRFHNEYLKMKS